MENADIVLAVTDAKRAVSNVLSYLKTDDETYKAELLKHISAHIEDLNYAREILAGCEQWSLSVWAKAKKAEKAGA